MAGPLLPSLVVDAAGRVLSANAAADRMAGRPLAGLNLRDLLPERHWTTFQRHAASGTAAPRHIPIPSIDRGEVVVRVRTVDVRREAALAARAVQLL